MHCEWYFCSSASRSRAGGAAPQVEQRRRDVVAACRLAARSSCNCSISCASAALTVIALYFMPCRRRRRGRRWRRENFVFPYALMRAACVFADLAGRRQHAAGLRAAAEKLFALGLDRQPLQRGQAAGIERRHADQRMKQRDHRVVDDLARRHDDRSLAGPAASTTPVRSSRLQARSRRAPSGATSG